MFGNLRRYGTRGRDEAQKNFIFPFLSTFWCRELKFLFLQAKKNDKRNFSLPTLSLIQWYRLENLDCCVWNSFVNIHGTDQSKYRRWLCALRHWWIRHTREIEIFMIFFLFFFSLHDKLRKTFHHFSHDLHFKLSLVLHSMRLKYEGGWASSGMSEILKTIERIDCLAILG